AAVAFGARVPPALPFAPTLAPAFTFAPPPPTPTPTPALPRTPTAPPSGPPAIAGTANIAATADAIRIFFMASSFHQAPRWRSDRPNGASAVPPRDAREISRLAVAAA